MMKKSQKLYTIQFTKYDEAYVKLNAYDMIPDTTWGVFLVTVHEYGTKSTVDYYNYQNMYTVNNIDLFGGENFEIIEQGDIVMDVVCNHVEFVGVECVFNQKKLYLTIEDTK